jgi:hypothetical protein
MNGQKQLKEVQSRMSHTQVLPPLPFSFRCLLHRPDSGRSLPIVDQILTPLFDRNSMVRGEPHARLRYNVAKHILAPTWVSLASGWFSLGHSWCIGNAGNPWRIAQSRILDKRNLPCQTCLTGCICAVGSKHVRISRHLCYPMIYFTMRPSLQVRRAMKCL